MGRKPFFTSLLILSLFMGPVFATSTSMEAYGLDTMAGYATFLRTSPMDANEQVVFNVKNPYGEVTTLNAVTNASGTAQAQMSGDDTQVSGIYEVSVKYATDGYFYGDNAFTVYPADVSQKNSSIYPENQVVQAENEKAHLKVTLLDAFNNPIKDHIIKLVSSSNYDLVSASAGSTNENGEIDFEIESQNSGTITYTVYDVTADKVLDERAKVVFFQDSDYVFVNDIPQSYEYSAAGSPSSAVDSFKFENVPETINVGESITFDVTAKDVSDQDVTNYDGTIRFSVTSDNSSFANLPEDYTFTPADLGSHTFSLAMSFQEAGTYAVEVRDLEDLTISGVYDFVVAANSTSSESPITISNPTSGTYSNNIQVISGTAPAGSALKIFDNDLETGSLVTNSSGEYSFTTNKLADGEHALYVATVNEVGTITGTSETVNLKIDTSGPQITNIVLEPAGEVDPGTVITAKIYTDDDLSQAALLFNGNIFDTVRNEAGYYEGTFAAPIEFGDYDLGLLLVDQLGNEVNLENQATVSVGVLPEVTTKLSVDDVIGLTAVSNDGRVTLQWDPVQNGDNPISNYRVYYGISPNQLTEAVDTFTNSNTWYIPNLENGTQYYFAVIAVDDKGNVSEHFSNIVSVVPGPEIVEVVPPEVTVGTAGEEAISDMKTDAAQSGPEITWLVICSLLGGMFYSFTPKRLF